MVSARFPCRAARSRLGECIRWLILSRNRGYARGESHVGLLTMVRASIFASKACLLRSMSSRGRSSRGACFGEQQEGAHNRTQRIGVNPEAGKPSGSAVRPSGNHRGISPFGLSTTSIGRAGHTADHQLLPHCEIRIGPNTNHRLGAIGVIGPGLIGPGIIGPERTGADRQGRAERPPPLAPANGEDNETWWDCRRVVRFTPIVKSRSSPMLTVECRAHRPR
jgi:hypothetical protein